jgi:hypothetical protein
MKQNFSLKSVSNLFVKNLSSYGNDIWKLALQGPELGTASYPEAVECE